MTREQLIEALHNAKQNNLSIGECWNLMDAAADMLEVDGVPVAWQSRIFLGGGWSEWKECAPLSDDEPLDVLLGGRVAHQFRKLYTAPQPAMEWKPIETAPIDVSVLVTFSDGDIPKGYVTLPGVMIAYKDKYYLPGGGGYEGDGDGWVDASSGEQCHLHYGQPTHWMPLPPAPESAHGITENKP